MAMNVLHMIYSKNIDIKKEANIATDRPPGLIILSLTYKSNWLDIHLLIPAVPDCMALLEGL